MTLSADIQVGQARITGKLAPIFEQIGIQMDTAAATLPHREAYQYSRTPVRTSSPLDIMQLMDRLNVANGSAYRNSPEGAAQ
jgi:hypothetical protein